MYFRFLFGTQIGKKGHKNVLIQNISSIVEGTLILILSLIWILNFEFNNYIYGLIAIGLILLICGIISICGIIRETQDDLITERLSNISIVSTGYNNNARKLEGTVNEEKRSFILRGKDKALAKSIKDNNPNYIVIAYHSSSHRIESISINP